MKNYTPQNAMVNENKKQALIICNKNIVSCMFAIQVSLRIIRDNLADVMNENSMLSVML